MDSPVFHDSGLKRGVRLRCHVPPSNPDMAGRRAQEEGSAEGTSLSGDSHPGDPAQRDWVYLPHPIGSAELGRIWRRTL